MSHQSDWVSGPQPASPFRDIRNQRSSTAQTKAELCLIIGRLCLKPPASVVNGSIQQVREWKKHQKAALAKVASSRASVTDLEMELKSLRVYEA